VRKGDTVETVSEEFAVPAKMVRSWNRLKGNSVAGRKVLYLHLPVTPGAVETHAASKSSSSRRTDEDHRFHEEWRRAAQGPTGRDALLDCYTYKTTVAALQRTNHNTATLRPGMV